MNLYICLYVGYFKEINVTLRMVADVKLTYQHRKGCLSKQTCMWRFVAIGNTKKEFVCFPTSVLVYMHVDICGDPWGYREFPSVKDRNP